MFSKIIARIKWLLGKRGTQMVGPAGTGKVQQPTLLNEAQLEALRDATFIKDREIDWENLPLVDLQHQFVKKMFERANQLKPNKALIYIDIEPDEALIRTEVERPFDPEELDHQINRFIDWTNSQQDNDTSGLNYSLFIRDANATEDTPHDIHMGGPSTEDHARQMAWESCREWSGYLRSDRAYFIGGYKTEDISPGVINVRTWKQIDSTTGELGHDLGTKSIKIK